MFDLTPFNQDDNTRTPSESIFDTFGTNVLNDFMSLSNTSFRTDIKETETEYVIEAELPGLSKKDINLELEDDYLTISAKNEETIEEESEDYLRKERRIGSYQRSFRLNNVNEAEIAAEYENGILKITLPKEEPGSKKRRTIDIN